MENNLQVFSNDQFGEVRTAVVDGNPMFCGSDVARALGYKDTVNALKSHCTEDGVAFYHLTDSLGREQKTKFVSEGNVYRLITHSKLPSAEKFERWVFDEVLPDIRKHGMYMSYEQIEQMLVNPDTLITALTAYKQEKELRMKAEARIEEQKPLVEFAETVCKSADAILVRDMAKLMCQQHITIGEKRLFKLLRDRGVLMIDNAPYQTYIDRGYFQVREGSYNTPYGTTILTKTTLVTPKGQVWLVGKVSEWMPISEREEIS